MVKSTPRSPHEVPSDHETEKVPSWTKSFTFTDRVSPSSSLASLHSFNPFSSLVLNSGISDSKVETMESSCALVGRANTGSNDLKSVPRYVNSHHSWSRWNVNSIPSKVIFGLGFGVLEKSPILRQIQRVSQNSVQLDFQNSSYPSHPRIVCCRTGASTTVRDSTKVREAHGQSQTLDKLGDRGDRTSTREWQASQPHHFEFTTWQKRATFRATAWCRAPRHPNVSRDSQID